MALHGECPYRQLLFNAAYEASYEPTQVKPPPETGPSSIDVPTFEVALLLTTLFVVPVKLQFFVLAEAEEMFRRP